MSPRNSNIPPSVTTQFPYIRHGKGGNYARFRWPRCPGPLADDVQGMQWKGRFVLPLNSLRWVDGAEEVSYFGALSAISQVLRFPHCAYRVRRKVNRAGAGPSLPVFWLSSRFQYH